ncbi:MAG: hypothetical protein F4X92_01600 [Gammaproteobacteria bacterium]|nr:hypothetical protein [Gammaproteobacteria bacterium]
MLAGSERTNISEWATHSGINQKAGTRAVILFWHFLVRRQIQDMCSDSYRRQSLIFPASKAMIYSRQSIGS